MLLSSGQQCIPAFDEEECGLDLGDYNAIDIAEEEGNSRDLVSLRESFYEHGVHQPPKWGNIYRSAEEGLLHIQSWGGQAGAYMCWENRGGSARLTFQPKLTHPTPPTPPQHPHVHPLTH